MEKQLCNTLIKNNVISQEQANHCWQIVENAAKQNQNISFSSILLAKKYVQTEQLTFYQQQLQKNKNIDTTHADFPALCATKIKPGEHFGHYQIYEELGRGGMGAVYKAHDKKLNRFVALKVILAGENVSEKQIDRFMLEARSMAKLRHPNIIEIYEIGNAPQNYFTMEYIEGNSLFDAVMRSSTEILPRKIARIIAQCAQALVEVHKQGIIHRDIKSANIMLGKENVKLMDFGLAKVLEENLSQTGEIMGTPAFMSPEQVQGKKLDSRSDIYSLGATLYEVISKRPPFQGNSFVNIACQIAENDPVAPRTLDPDIPIDLEAICLKCLEKDPKKRYSNAVLLAKDLENFVKNKPITAKPSTKITLLKKWILRNKNIAIVSFLAFLLVSLSIAVVIYSLNKQAKIEKEIAKKADIDKKKAIEKFISQLITQAQQKWQQGDNNKACQIYLKALKESKQANISPRLVKIVQRQLSFCFDEIYKRKQTFKNKISPSKRKTFPPGNKIAYSPDGKTFAIAKENGAIKLYRGKKMSILKEHSQEIWSLAFSPNGKALVSAGGEDQKINLWDVEKQQVVTNCKEKARANAAIFSPDGKYIVFGSGGKSWGFLSLWNVKKAKIQRIMRHNAIYGLSFSPTGKYLAFIATENIYVVNFIALLNLMAKNSQQAFKKSVVAQKHIRLPIATAFSSDGSALAVCSSNGILKVWDTKIWDTRLMLKGHHGPILKLAFNHTPFDQILATGGKDTAIRLWDLQGNLRHILHGHSHAITGIKFNRNNSISSCDYNENIYHWRPGIKRLDSTFKTLRRYLTSVTDIAFHPDRQSLILGSNNGPTIRWWYKAKKRALVGIELANIGVSGVSSIAITPEGSHVIVANKGAKMHLWKLPTHSSDKIEAKDETTCMQRKEKAWETPNYVVDSEFSPNRKILALASKSDIQLWNASMTKTLATFKVSDQFYNIAFSPDGKSLAVAGSKKVYLWDIKTKKVIFDLKKISKEGKGLAFSADGKFLAFGSENIVYIHNFTSKKLTKLKGHKYQITALAFSPKKGILASGSEGAIVYLWDINLAYNLLTLKGHSDAITCMAFNYNGTYLASGAKDYQVRLWNVQESQTFSIEKVKNFLKNK